MSVSDVTEQDFSGLFNDKKFGEDLFRIINQQEDSNSQVSDIDSVNTLTTEEFYEKFKPLEPEYKEKYESFLKGLYNITTLTKEKIVTVVNLTTNQIEKVYNTFMELLSTENKIKKLLEETIPRTLIEKDIKTKLQELAKELESFKENVTSLNTETNDPNFLTNLSKIQYLDKLDKIKEYISNNDIPIEKRKAIIIGLNHGIKSNDFTIFEDAINNAERAAQDEQDTAAEERSERRSRKRGGSKRKNKISKSKRSLKGGKKSKKYSKIGGKKSKRKYE